MSLPTFVDLYQYFRKTTSFGHSVAVNEIVDGIEPVLNLNRTSQSPRLVSRVAAQTGGRLETAFVHFIEQQQASWTNGAHHVIATEEEDLVTRVMEITNGLGAPVVFDPVGGPSFGPLTQSMSRGGTLLA